MSTRVQEARPDEAYRAIGILDSGVGGLTVLREMEKLLPGERLIYVGDTARMPYGPRPVSQVRRYALEMITFLRHQDVKLIVVACNSAAAAGLSHYQRLCAEPVLGVIEPGVREALARTSNGRIGVIGTAGTIGSGAYESTLRRLDPGVAVFSKACPLFVLLVENDLLDTEEALGAARQYLAPLVEAEIDVLILGCTHYPLMEDLIRQIVGPEVTLVNSARAIAASVASVLDASGTVNPLPGGEPRQHFFVTGRPGPFEEVGGRLLGREIRAYAVQL